MGTPRRWQFGIPATAASLKPLYVNGVFRERDQVGLAVGFEGEAKADAAGGLGLAAFSFKDIAPEQAATLDWLRCGVVAG